MNVKIADPKAAQVFRFLERSYDPDSGVVTLAYAFDDGPELVETLVFPQTGRPQDSRQQAAFLRALDLLHLLAGVSYFKAGLPAKLDVGDHRIDASLAEFLEQTWRGGLAELAHVNGIDLAGLIRFPVTAPLPADAQNKRASAVPLELPRRALLAMGGGKDSLVSLELLRAAEIEMQPVTVGSSALIAQTAQAAELPLLCIQRTLSPLLTAMNQAGAWNGHVPVTAINSAILACAAVLYGYRWVVFSNERSADEATLFNAAGEPVNHQYSKGLAFEQGFIAQLQQRVAPDLTVFSLLRTRSEVAIARMFSKQTRYHPVFSSCNRNFHRDGSRIDGRWCGACPKCRFTSLALAPWLDASAIIDIFGRNLLDDAQQLDGYRQLAALGVDKPFECVGTVAESRALLDLLAQDPHRSRLTVVAALRDEVAGAAEQLPELLALAGEHCIPEELAARVAV